MADSLNTTNLSRRSILGTGIAAAGALAILGPLPIQSAEADAEIARLYVAYVEADQRDYAANVRWDEARGRAVVAAKAKLGIKKGKPFRIMSIEAWQAAVAKQVEALGFGLIRDASEAALEARYEAWQALADAPAQTVTGIAFKLVALLQWDDELQDVLKGKIDGELGHTKCLAARADALRLARLPNNFGTEEV